MSILATLQSSFGFEKSAVFVIKKSVLGKHIRMFFIQYTDPEHGYQNARQIQNNYSAPEIGLPK
jgi:hypothetical protein